MKRLIVVLTIVLFFMAPGVSGAVLDNDAVIGAVEDYLNSVSTLKARFIQTADDGGQAAGDFLLKRPGRMRFQYDPPVKDFIVADGTFIYYYDSEIRRASSTLISKSLADFFLHKDIKLSGDVSVTGITQAEGTLQITIVQTDDPVSGSMTLFFTAQPLSLNGWRVTDAQGLVTEVTLSDIETGIPLERNLFFYYDPIHQQEKFN